MQIWLVKVTYLRRVRIFSVPAETKTNAKRLVYKFVNEYDDIIDCEVIPVAAVENMINKVFNEEPTEMVELFK